MAWGGEPEMLCASAVVQRPITVYHLQQVHGRWTRQQLAVGPRLAGRWALLAGPAARAPRAPASTLSASQLQAPSLPALASTSKAPALSSPVPLPPLIFAPPQGALEPIVTYGDALLAAGVAPVSLLWSGAHYDLLLPATPPQQQQGEGEGAARAA
jgi:hypothetical protein